MTKSRTPPTRRDRDQVARSPTPARGVRVVNTYEAAAAVPEMMRKLRGLGVDVPAIGDSTTTATSSSSARRWPPRSRVRINPGNAGAKRRRALRDDR
jgi:4-hydroxy-3-methylbut-2-en-1-yl diphosphate synthase IspG/GcpE